MTDMETVEPQKGFNKNFFWKVVYVVLLVGTCLSFYWATQQTDYIWRWNRLPRYFYYIETVDVKAEIEGEVTSISKKGDDSVVIVSDGAESEYYTIPGSDLRVDIGDTIYMGDSLGEYEEGRCGLLLEGLLVTIEVSLVAIVFGILLGLFTGLARLSSNPCIKWTAITYIELIRGTPLLVQIMIWYFVIGTIINNLSLKAGLPQIPELWFGIASLAIFAGAYVAEIVRAGIQSIHKGQMEAARSLGMTKTTAMIKIILPQAFKRILPPLAGQFISLIKDSSLLGVIAIREMTKATREAVTTSLMPYELWFLCGVMYLVLTFALSMFVQYLERRTTS
ncbi:amino acid ABC transporter permease [Pseudodesulfovibrio piezophilus]|uniref:Putative glutamine transport system permease protein GlnP n=1 Tax=Pseudodesulfovibrio piezophilus (strain DSM 21447 / JCM 15486 / C1TLV30) TaxID=1322246 RepID=M1WUG6_PSEP2|nr:amino acid ABC transporter permease [Pseudodesulfovibrio piezophilus]CCH47303.1 Polar amino acid ABC transporter, inner membrane subunit [Pseudodesulfovibrio piezophilus C1TLV30]